MWVVPVLFCCLQFGIAVRPALDNKNFLQIYKELNAAWFNGKLPEDHVRISWDSITERNGDIAFTWITNYEGEGERISIVLSPRMKNCGSCTKMLLLHEMAHIKLRKRKVRDVHGREFQHEMQRLARIGAFRDLW